MNIAFKIPPADHNYAELHLIAEVGHNEISFLIFGKSPLSLHGFYMYSLNRHISAEEYAEALETTIHKEHVLHQRFASCNIFCNVNESVLIPSEFYTEAEKENYSALLFGIDKSSLCFIENVPGNAIKNVYRIPGRVYEILNRFFPGNTFRHSTSLQLNIGIGSGDAMECIVYHNIIKVLLFKEGQVQIVQYFEYEGPVDVCYHLLNVCERFAVSPEYVQLTLSGMVDEHSNLYKEIDNYFQNVSFVSLTANAVLAQKLEEHPHQFYAHLTALATCV